MISKHYATLADGHQTHYRYVAKSDKKPGEESDKKPGNSTLIMLHASPMSSEVMMPTLQALEGNCDLIAPDTPGYGQSDPLSAEQLAASPDLSPYVDWLARFIDALGLEKVGVYGSATGAQIAIEFGKKYADRTDFLILDNAAHFSDEERDQVMEHYFPDLSAQPDGSHLEKIWEISNSLFQWFPWYQKDDEHLISSAQPPLVAVQATAKAYLLAGADYDQAYRRAFANEKASRLQSVQVPTTVIRWQGSLLKKYTDRFDEYDWPEHIKMSHCGKSNDERMGAIRQVLSNLNCQT